MDSETVATLPDIQTARPIMSFLRKFHEIINKKTLSDFQKHVYHAGRYNSGSTVRVDQGAVHMTLTDEVAMQLIQGANDALEQSIDQHIKTNGYARPIMILDAVYEKSPLIPFNSLNNDRSVLPFVEYKNYYFGRAASTITEPSQCTITRGST
jgi:hypothetical protein